jgi:hypothetical protein
MSTLEKQMLNSGKPGPEADEDPDLDPLGKPKPAYTHKSAMERLDLMKYDEP